ncbi:hypothetical protein ID852_15935 [Xenorhabdus sp. 42]|nr:hypothetical protein [Xenorhabdus sp. 38]MBD2794273.1 hypothetical protein [Xenorhabdus sp. CUL]MBD2799772.1 hypothetical protein [Xenorhabdus sp. M]MBD2822146.1 hypothetical protein [Xenorhabdus sp. 42]MBD2826969.1 hypothetical protein [Xenorhabdus sp. 5]
MKNDEKVIESIFNELFHDDFLSYKDILTTPSDNNQDGIYSRAKIALSKLDNEDQSAILNFFRIIMADTASTIFGTIDGSHFPPNINGDFTLLYEDEEIQGNLQDLFIEKYEDLDNCH